MRYGLSISVKRVIPSCPPLTNFKITREAGRREERKWCLPQGGMERSAFHRVSAELEEGTSRHSYEVAGTRQKSRNAQVNRKTRCLPREAYIHFDKLMVGHITPLYYRRRKAVEGWIEN